MIFIETLKKTKEVQDKKNIGDRNSSRLSVGCSGMFRSWPAGHSMEKPYRLDSRHESY